MLIILSNLKMGNILLNTFNNLIISKKMQPTKKYFLHYLNYQFLYLYLKTINFHKMEHHIIHNYLKINHILYHNKYIVFLINHKLNNLKYLNKHILKNQFLNHNSKNIEVNI